MDEKKRKLQTVFALVFLALTLFSELSPALLPDERKDFFLSRALPLVFGSCAFFLLMKREGSGLFGKPTNLLYLLPALVIAVDNFQFAAFFAGKMQPIKADVFDWILFSAYCLATGIFEELVFRGTIFPIVADKFEKNKKGLLKTVVCTSLIFGFAHLFNLFSGGGAGVLLQVGYSCLTGALFAFVLIKTKNVLLCGFTHGLYNFCGLLFSAEQGLGAGVVLDLPTALTMLVVSLIVAGFAVYSFYKYTENERKELYSRLGFGVNE